MLIEREWDNMRDIANFGNEKGLMHGAPFVTEDKYLQEVRVGISWNFAPL